MPLLLARTLLLRAAALPRRASMLATRAATNENAAPPPTKLAKMEAPIPPLRVKKLVPHAKLPVRGSAGAAGYDLAR